MCGSAPSGGGGAQATPYVEPVQAVASKQAKKVNEFTHNNTASLAAVSSGGTVATSTLGVGGTVAGQNQKLRLGE